MKKLLFISADKDLPQCSFQELGVEFNRFLQQCDSIETTFFNAGSKTDPVPPYNINNEFDLILFNYHFIVMGFFSREFFDSIKIPKIIVNYETRFYPWNSPCSQGSLHDIFQYMIIPDTNIDKKGDDDVILLPRVIQRTDFEDRPINMNNPIFSTYGLPSPDKDLIGQLVAINEEFDNATYRMHCPPDSRGGNGMMRNMADACRRIAKPGITVEFDESFYSPEHLLNWLNESDLNMFFYHPHRDEVTAGTFPGSIDRAIAVKRPIVVKDMLCTKYVLNYIDPYPKSSLRQIMEKGTVPTFKMYEDGDPQKAAVILDEWLKRKFG